MPVILLTKNFKIYIYPKDYDPQHVHVIGPDCEAKFSIRSLDCIQNYGFSKKDINRISKFLEENIDILIEAWEDYHENE